MAKVEIKLPKMGESVAEATITSWLKEVGDTIDIDDTLVEVATDKVDTEVPSETSGVLLEKCFEENDIVQIGQTLAIIETEGEDTIAPDESTNETSSPEQGTNTEDLLESIPAEATTLEARMEKVAQQSTYENTTVETEAYYSPLVRTIAKKEGISNAELASISGTGKNNRVTKNDILAYLSERTTSNDTDTIVKSNSVANGSTTGHPDVGKVSRPQPVAVNSPPSSNGELKNANIDERIPMSRMGKLIAGHMTKSLQTSAHVQSIVEADVTSIVEWRNTVKTDFQKKTGEKLTFTPIFIEIVAKALRDFPLLNISVEEDTILKKAAINIGMATALPDGNLIVPVIRNADRLNLIGLAKEVNGLAHKARNNQLNPDDVQGGTYTVTNVGSFGTLIGTPIINQPQVGILALGAIQKVPAVIETPEGDFIGIRHKMFLSHSYDHRVVNGALGGQFVQRVQQYIEAWDKNRSV